MSVENKPGAGGTFGTGFAARAAAALNIQVIAGTPEEFGALIKRDYVSTGKLVRELGLQPK